MIPIPGQPVADSTRVSIPPARVKIGVAAVRNGVDRLIYPSLLTELGGPVLVDGDTVVVSNIDISYC
jgi:hypothetical protein